MILCSQPTPQGMAEKLPTNYVAMTIAKRREISWFQVESCQNCFSSDVSWDVGRD